MSPSSKFSRLPRIQPPPPACKSKPKPPIILPPWCACSGIQPGLTVEFLQPPWYGECGAYSGPYGYSLFYEDEGLCIWVWESLDEPDDLAIHLIYDPTVDRFLSVDVADLYRTPDGHLWGSWVTDDHNEIWEACPGAICRLHLQT